MLKTKRHCFKMLLFYRHNREVLRSLPFIVSDLTQTGYSSQRKMEADSYTLVISKSIISTLEATRSSPDYGCCYEAIVSSRGT